MVAVVTITITLSFFLLSLPDTDQEIRMVRLKVFLVRSKIDNFFSTKGKYPDTLKELEVYLRNISGPEFNIISFEEHISNPMGVGIESDVLNGEGGWYYDKIKGELRLNITRPIKYYKNFYFGKYRNDIPSEW